MPIDYRIDVQRGIVFTTGHGVVADEDIRCHARDLKHDRLFEPTFRQFADLSQVDTLNVTSSGIAWIVGEANPFPPHAIRAYYAPRAVVFGMSRMFQLRHTESGMLVTVSREEAERHVGLAPGESMNGGG